MLRRSAIAALLAPPLLALACGAPFIGVAPEANAGVPSEDVEGFAGKLANGGRPGVVVKPSLGGTDNGGTGATAQAGATGEPESAGAGGAPWPGDPSKCPQLEGERLVLANGFCIDENEVTVAHYRAFVAGTPSTLDQPLECAGNTTFANGCKYNDAAREPQRCADWCDARAYCASIGKHLCGSSTGAMPFDAPPVATEHRWYSACSLGGKVVYPYGDEYDGSACWGADRPVMGTYAVKSASSCVGGYEGLWDMSGGLAEWVDSCNGVNGATDACHIRGGASSATAEQLRCDAESAAPRNTSSANIGFRCCADLTR
jgi:formylglycine-generating enzyme